LGGFWQTRSSFRKAQEKAGMQPLMDQVTMVVSVVNDAKKDYSEDETGHGPSNHCGEQQSERIEGSEE